MYTYIVCIHIYIYVYIRIYIYIIYIYIYIYTYVYVYVYIYRIYTYIYIYIYIYIYTYIVYIHISIIYICIYMPIAVLSVHFCCHSSPTLGEATVLALIEVEGQGGGVVRRTLRDHIIVATLKRIEGLRIIITNKKNVKFQTIS